MVKLKQLAPQLQAVRPVIAYLEVKPDTARDQHQSWRAWYKTSAWQRLRWEVLKAARFTCARCNRVEGKTRLLVADHKVPHRGNHATFWDRDNLQCLCKSCHDGDKQREEVAMGHRSGRPAGGGGV